MEPIVTREEMAALLRGVAEAAARLQAPAPKKKRRRRKNSAKTEARPQ